MGKGHQVNLGQLQACVKLNKQISVRCFQTLFWILVRIIKQAFDKSKQKRLIQWWQWNI